MQEGAVYLDEASFLRARRAATSPEDREQVERCALKLRRGLAWVKAAWTEDQKALRIEALREAFDAARNSRWS